MEESSEKWRAQFQEEVLPELEKQFESLRESLEKLGQSEEVQKLKQKLEGLSRNLNDLVKRFCNDTIHVNF